MDQLQIDQERWLRIEAILDEALELDPAEVPELLERACAGEPGLRAEVEQLLAAGREAGPFLESSSAEYAASLLEAMGSSSSVQIGSNIAHFEITAKLGEGGMGAVYKARDRRLDRDVALKILPPEVTGDADRLSRFEREARILAALSHPNIATIHDVREEDGVHCLVMELAVGKSLDERLAEMDAPAYPHHWRPDGQVLFTVDFQIWQQSVDDSERRERLLGATASVDEARFSPDGRWISYIVNETEHEGSRRKRYAGSARDGPKLAIVDPLTQRARG